MSEDPLSCFAHEKVAADAPTTSLDEDYKIPQAVSRYSLDPGERALAGALSVSGALSTKLLPFIGRVAVSGHLEKGSVKWNAPPIQDAKSIADALGESSERLPHTKARFMGLFDVKGRPRATPSTVEEAVKYQKKYTGKLLEIQPVVDSFIDKHNLTQKGVRINIQHGPLSAQQGGSFSKATKGIFLPRVGKELALHELGHAADYTKGLGKLRRFTDPVLSRGALVALPIALAAGDRIKEMIPGTVDDKVISFMQDNAPQIMGATLAATTLIPEARASMLAVKHIKELELAGKQPAGSAMKAFKKLAPMWGTYLLGAIPAVVGMSLARKYMRNARAEKAELQSNIDDLEKNSGLQKTALSEIEQLISHGKDLAHVAKAIGRGASKLVTDKNSLRRIGSAAKEVGQSPEFVLGALSAAVPATMGALYMYGTPGGEHIRNRLHPASRDIMLGHGRKEILGASKMDEEWRSRNPLRFAGLVAMGAALSGGILSKFTHDLMKVL